MSQRCMAIGCNQPAADLHDFCYTCGVDSAIEMAIDTAHEVYDDLRDPTLKDFDPHQPGAKADSGKVRMHLVTGGMARAITEVAKVSTFGANKYTDGGWVTVPNGFNRYEDAQQRHAAYRHMGEEYDQESGLSHLAHEAWNALAKLDLYLRANEAPF